MKNETIEKSIAKIIMSNIINPCKCGSKKEPNWDSDDMHPSWSVKCYDCGQFQYDNWNSDISALNKWNKENPINELLKSSI